MLAEGEAAALVRSGGGWRLVDGTAPRRSAARHVRLYSLLRTAVINIVESRARDESFIVLTPKNFRPARCIYVRFGGK